MPGHGLHLVELCSQSGRGCDCLRLPNPGPKQLNHLPESLWAPCGPPLPLTCSGKSPCCCLAPDPLTSCALCQGCPQICLLPAGRPGATVGRDCFHSHSVWRQRPLRGSAAESEVLRSRLEEQLARPGSHSWRAAEPASHFSPVSPSRFISPPFPSILTVWP